MSRCCRLRGASISPVILCLLLAVGCSRPVGLHGNDGAAQGDKAQVPFQDGQSGSGNTAALTPPDRVQKAEGLPFRDSQSLPVGTLLTVRLSNPITTDAPGASGRFEAVVEEPVSIEGNTLVPRGASVAGRVESARASKVRANRNYIRLTLDSMDIAGRDFQVQTSSLFAHGNASVTALTGDENPAAVIHLEKGHRLTFRLTEPVYVASQQPISSR
jgi:hypothetical protein